MKMPFFPDMNAASIFFTGGGSGIGAALTGGGGVLRQGVRVAFVQRSDGLAFCDEIERETGSCPLFIRCDITNSEALAGTVAEAASAHGRVRVLVNNAANDTRPNDGRSDPWGDFRSNSSVMGLKTKEHPSTHHPPACTTLTPDAGVRGQQRHQVVP